MTPPQAAVPVKRMRVDEFWDFVHLPENEHRSFELRCVSTDRTAPSPF